MLAFVCLFSLSYSLLCCPLSLSLLYILIQNSVSIIHYLCFYLTPSVLCSFLSEMALEIMPASFIQSETLYVEIF